MTVGNGNGTDGSNGKKPITHNTTDGWNVYKTLTGSVEPEGWAKLASAVSRLNSELLVVVVAYVLAAWIAIKLLAAGPDTDKWLPFVIAITVVVSATTLYAFKKDNDVTSKNESN